MGTYIVGAVLALCLFFALKKAAAHFRGEGECCGGASLSVPEKKLCGKITDRIEIKINGMTCVNCKNRVEHLLNGIDGAAAKVNLTGGAALLEATRKVSDEEIFAALKDSGYDVLSVKRK